MVGLDSCGPSRPTLIGSTWEARTLEARTPIQKLQPQRRPIFQPRGLQNPPAVFGVLAAGQQQWWSRSDWPASGGQMPPSTTSSSPKQGKNRAPCPLSCDILPIAHARADTYYPHRRTARNSKPLEVIGTYDPLPKKTSYDTSGKQHKNIQLDIDRAKYWIGVGAQPSEPVWRFLTMVRWTLAPVLLYTKPHGGEDRRC